MVKKLRPSTFKPFFTRFTLRGNSFLDFFYEMSLCGDVVKLPTMRKNYLINDPAIIHHILINNAENYTKGKTGYDRVEKIVGKGLLTNSGSVWAKHRHLLQPQFHTKNMSHLTSLVNEYTNRCTKKWSANEGLIDFSNEMLSLTMDISAMALLGIDLHHESHELVKHIHLMNNYSTKPNTFTWWLPSIYRLRFRKSEEYINKALLLPYLKNYDKVAFSTIKPLLYGLLAKDEHGQHLLTQEEFLGEAKNFFVAGHETTGNALSWTMYCILHHPYTLLEIRKELAFLKGNPPEFDDLEKMPFLDMVINESLRLFPPIWILYRRALGDDFAENYEIPGGTIITICTYYLHRNEKYWPNPRTFSPERFAVSASQTQRPKCAFLPFGTGPRVCIGKQFAIMNMKLILANILQNFDFKFPKDNYFVKPLPLITLKPAKNIKVIVTRRK